MRKRILLMSIGLTALVLYCFIPVHQASSKAKLARCRSNLHRIGQALFAYSDDNNDSFPVVDGDEGLKVLVKNGYLENSSFFQCPMNCDGTDSIDYTYISGFCLQTDKSDIAICCDKASNHPDIINVLFSDGSVRSFNNPDWENKMQKYLENSVSNPMNVQ